MSQLDTFGADYLRLTLEIDKHIDGYIDAYYGPAALRDEVRAAPLRSPADLLDDVDPVSYTHLDVYKRQLTEGARTQSELHPGPEGAGRTAARELKEETTDYTDSTDLYVPRGCLLYTSRCV